MQHDIQRTNKNTSDDWAAIQRRIDWRARRLARCFRLGTHDREDLRQSMTLDVTRAMGRHDPARSSRMTYLSGVLDKCYLHHARRLATRRPRPARLDSDSPSCDARRPDPDRPPEHRVVRGEVAEAVHLLPDDLAHLAWRLMCASPREIAHAEGVHRGTIYRRINRLRPYFEALHARRG